MDFNFFDEPAKPGLLSPSGAGAENTRRTRSSCTAGPGVLPEELDQLFQRFSRLSGAEIKERGTGLGLFIAREILLKHGGDLRVESLYPEWIDFILTLPAAETGA